MPHNNEEFNLPKALKMSQALKKFGIFDGSLTPSASIDEYSLQKMLNLYNQKDLPSD